MSTISTDTVPQTCSPQLPPRKMLAALLHDLGDVSADRVRLHPYPGTATEADAIEINASGCLCELIEGTIVEKPMGCPEAFMASLLLQFIGPFVRLRQLGITTTPDGMYRMIRGNIREPDVSFTSKGRMSTPMRQVAGWCPDLCVEIVSPSNSKNELAAKREEYFQSGCLLVWEIDLRSRTADVYSDPSTAIHLTESDTLYGSDVLPGFVLPLAELFAAFDEGSQLFP